MKKTILFATIIIQTMIAHSQSKNLQDWLDGIEYGDQPAITQLDGYGNSKYIIELKQESIDTIMSGFPWRDMTPDYKAGYGPIEIKVIDPLNLYPGKLYLKFDSISSYTSGYAVIQLSRKAKWYIYNNEGDTVFADQWINIENEQMIPEWGISVKFEPVTIPYLFPENGNVLGSTIEFEDPEKPWLKFYEDGDIPGITNWIRSGSDHFPNDDYGDPYEFYENICEGQWAPFRFCSIDKYHPSNIYWVNFEVPLFQYQRLSSVDVVITGDSSKWTRCPVVELCPLDSIDTDGDSLFDDVGPGPAGVWKLHLRNSPSVDKNGNSINIGVGDDTLSNPNLSNYIASKGMGWFPGYAIDQETGERMNMIFGENSQYTGQNGNDMIWNPTGELYSDLFISSGNTEGEPWLGGMHYIYVLGHNEYLSTEWQRMTRYDAGLNTYQKLISEYNSEFVYAFVNAMWVAIPYRDTSYDFMETDVKIKIRMANPYRVAHEGYLNDIQPNLGKPMYEIDLTDFSDVKELPSSNIDISFWPNPAHDIIHFNTENISGFQFEVYQISGVKIFSIKIGKDNLADISSLKIGVYLMKIKYYGFEKVYKLVKI